MSKFNTEIEVLTLVSTTSLTRDPGAPYLWVHRDLNGNEFSDRRQTLTAEEMREMTHIIEAAAGDFPIDDEEDYDRDADGWGWEDRALAGAHA